jgi:phosphate transport system substrate-binding protein
MMINSRILACLILVIFLVGCKDRKTSPGIDTPLNGTIHISVDESFKPIIQEQIRVYETDFPGTKIIADYKPEADCLRDFFQDSATRLVIVTRGLSVKEEQYMYDSLYYRPRWEKIANDAICIIVHPQNNDTLFTLERLKLQLTGKFNPEQSIVFDGLKATSTVRYIRDSILRGQPFDTAIVKAASNSLAVIDHVSKNVNSIGLVGVSWLGNPEDTAQLNLLKNVKIAYVQCGACKDTPYVKPVQESILTKRYPLVRGLHYMLKENYPGLGSGFVDFLKYERGQLIFKRAYLGPLMDFDIRKVKISLD